MDNYNKNLKKQITFRLNTDYTSPGCITNLRRLSNNKEASIWISKAVEFYYWYEFYTKGFLVDLLRKHFILCKYILRRIGRSQ